MRTKKAELNFIMNLAMISIGLLPLFFLRKVFLDALGSEYLGLVALFTSLIGFLSLAELGISTAIVYALYKPYAENDTEKIMGYVQFYTKFYRTIGLIIFITGLALMPFLPLFIKGDLDINDVRIYFLLTLASTVITYFFSARFSLLIAAQEGYRITVAQTASIVLIAFLQMAALYLYESFFLYLIIQLVINLFYLLILNAYIKKRFKWSSGKSGTIKIEEKRDLKKNIKALFIHKIGEFAVFGTDNLLISYYINIATVGIYNSYYMVISVATKMVQTAFNGITASIGNLLVEADKEKVYAIHKKLFFFNFWIASFIAISMFNTIQQFVLLWLGDSQFLDMFTISIILLNLYITLLRASVEKFKDAGGLYRQDQYSAILEAVVNLGFSIWLVQYFGLAGIFLGTLISNITVVFWIKPKIVYKYIFQEKLRKYFIMYFKYFSLALIALALTSLATMNLRTIVTIPAFLLNCFLNIGIINIFYIIIFRKKDEFLFFKTLIVKKFSRGLAGKTD
ncbi:lipopolysaccharide biosynthesis protein [Metaplanococcus flavidus]|uniref:Lipopolysaccharide biosynthesis protein n=1 Tax=Metaplanococcus flavidus TaxID=569883 RepID=A0ABW3LDU1_9BACL